MNTQNDFEKAMKKVADAFKEIGKKYAEIFNSMQELNKVYHDATKPKQGREAFRSFIENKEKNKYKR